MSTRCTSASWSAQLSIERDLVRRERSDEDRREYVVELTSAGERMRERVVELCTQIAEQMVDALGDSDLDDVHRIAGKLLTVLGDTTP